MLRSNLSRFRSDLVHLSAREIKKGAAVLLVILAAAFFFAGNASAIMFFQKPTSWSTKIPSNPSISANSSYYVNDIITNANWWYVQHTMDWGAPVYYATSSTPNVTVAYDGSSSYCQNAGLANGWNVVPIDPKWLPAGNSARCSGQYTDGMMEVISADGKTAWDFQQGRVCNGVWKAACVRKRDLTTEGEIYPYDLKGAIRAAYQPGLQGLIMWQDWTAWQSSGKHIDHALAFIYSSEVQPVHSCIYPCGADRQGPPFAQRPYMMHMGERLQLDPSYNCSGVSDSFTKMVCYALQEYGMIFVDSTSPGYNYIVAEPLAPDKPGETRSWSGIIPGSLNLPLRSLRVVSPITNLTAPASSSTSSSDTTAPSTPTGLAASVISSSQINLAWTASTDNVGVAGYKIYRNGTQIATTTTTSYSNTGLTASTKYSYTVAAYDAAGNVSSQSASASATTSSGADSTAPTTPAGLTGSAVSSSQINLSWTASTDNVGVTGYKIYRNGTQVGTSATTSYSDTGLAASTAYTYTVAAYDAAGNASGQSGQVSVTTPGTTTASSSVPDTIIDNGASGTSYTGAWYSSSATGAYGANSIYGSGGATYSWNATLPKAGVYNVYVWWTAFSNRSTSAPYTIAYSGGSKTVSVNQQANGGQWNYVGTFSFNTTGAKVTLNTPGNYPKTYSADAVKFVYAPGVLMDNGASGTSYTGAWYSSSATGAYGANSIYGSGGASYTWKPALPQSGNYDVYAWWTAFSNRSTGAPYTISYSGGSKTVSVNQQANGGQWNYLGTFYFDATQGGKVTLNTPGNYPTTYSSDSVLFLYKP